MYILHNLRVMIYDLLYIRIRNDAFFFIQMFIYIYLVKLFHFIN